MKYFVSYQNINVRTGKVAGIDQTTVIINGPDLDPYSKLSYQLIEDALDEMFTQDNYQHRPIWFQKVPDKKGN